MVLRQRRPGRAAVWMVAALFGASVAALQTQPARSHPPLSTVRVNGLVHHLPGPTTVATVLRAAAVRPHAGRLLSVVQHAVLADDAAPAVILVGGVVATPATPVHDGDDIVVMDGSDQVEDVVERSVPVPPPPGGLPDVEDALWYPGVAGTDVAAVGSVSGEVVSTRRALEPIGPRRERAPVVALTFDDGPDPRWTPQVLQVLAEEGVKATFCVVGFLARRFPDLVRAERDQGHVVCDHTEHHVEHLDTAPHDVVAVEIGDGARSVSDVLGPGGAPPLFRPPGGFLGPDVVATAHAGGMRVLRWSVDPHDYERPPPDVLAGRVLGAAGPGAVILLHDGGGDRANTVAALRVIIQQLKARGWAFATPMFGPPA